MIERKQDCSQSRDETSDLTSLPNDMIISTKTEVKHIASTTILPTRVLALARSEIIFMVVLVEVG